MNDAVIGQGIGKTYRLDVDERRSVRQVES
jgi:hypothetical protein